MEQFKRVGFSVWTYSTLYYILYYNICVLYQKWVGTHAGRLYLLLLLYYTSTRQIAHTHQHSTVVGDENVLLLLLLHLWQRIIILYRSVVVFLSADNGFLDMETINRRARRGPYVGRKTKMTAKLYSYMVYIQ